MIKAQIGSTDRRRVPGGAAGVPRSASPLMLVPALAPVAPAQAESSIEQLISA